MTNTLVHRGPDDSGTWTDPQLGLSMGHCRLAIIDVSSQGHQPMTSPSGRYCIVFNGEIYNHLDLRKQLKKGNTQFHGHSDTEVLVAAIERWGLLKTLEESVGMFAFALWDRDYRTLSLVRDRMGEKPLYYGYAGNTFVFGSELKALCASPGWQREIDRGALTLLMRYNYIPAPWSIYKNIYKLLPGCVLEVPYALLKKKVGIHPFVGDSTSAGMSPTCYWSPAELAEAGSRDLFQGGDGKAIDELERLLRNSIERQMIADVPLGALLSGGIDSSTVVALMQDISSKPVKTFTIGFHEDSYNEAEQARLVAGHLGTDHTELYVTPQEAMNVIPQLPTLYDEPFSDSSQVPTFLLSRLAREQVTVSLSGDGGDELFGGYNRYFWGLSIWNKITWLPAPLRALLSRSMSGVSADAWDKVFAFLGPVIPKRLNQPNPGDKIHKLANIIRLAHPEQIYEEIVSHWKEPARLVKDGFEPHTVFRAHLNNPIHTDFANRMMHLDTVSYLPDDILTKVDRASMSVSLEVRVPLLDHRVVEFANRLPLTMKLRNRQGKWLLRQLLYRYVPKGLVDKPKMGFGIPLDTWLRGPLRDWGESLLDKQRLAEEGFFDPEPIRQYWHEHTSGKRNWQYYLWDVLMFQAWLEISK